MELNKEDTDKFETYMEYIGEGSIKKSLIGIVLWLLSKEKMHGYKLIDVLITEFNLQTMGASKIYPILKKLEKEGFITAEKEKQGKRVKKVYSITKKGKEMMDFTKKFMSQNKMMRQFFKEMMT